MSSRPDARKRPSGSRPLQGRVFSDSSSLKSAVSDIPIERHTSEPSGPQYEEGSKGSHHVFLPNNLASDSVRLVDSPKAYGRAFSPVQNSSLPSGDHTSTATTRPKPRPLKKTSLFSSASVTSDGETPASPGLRRWETLRKHVLPSPAGSPEAPPIPAVPLVHGTLPSRPSTPKQFRLPRIGFKQVVEQAQEVSADRSRAFGDEILRSCLISRQGEHSVLKKERDALPTTAFNRTFMSTVTSVPGSAASSTTNIPQTRFGLRRPPSIQSIPTTIGLPLSSSLHSVISHYASVPLDGPRPSQDTLPYEMEVLSVLLTPFLDSSTTLDVEKNRLESIESFETIVKTWPSLSNEAELQRCFWCCKAAHSPSVPKMVRLRLLGVLSSGLFAPGVTFRANSPFVLQTLLQALFSLQAALSSQPDTREDVNYVRELIVGAMHGACGDLDPALVKADYGVDVSGDDDGFIKECVVAQALSACLELDAKSSKPVIVQFMAEDFWRVSTCEGILPARLIPLFSRVVGRLAQSVLDFLPPLDSPLRPGQAHATRQLFQIHLVPQANILDGAEAPECRSFVARIALRMLCMDDVVQQEDLQTYIVHWCNEGGLWKTGLELALRHMIKSETWPSIMLLLTTLVETLPQDVRAPVCASFLPALYERLAQDPPSYPFQPLTKLLATISQLQPQQFYKPLFACAAATKDATIVSHLQLIAVLARFYTDFWTSDVEMLLVVFMSVGNSSGAPRKVRLGQLVLLTEFIAHVQSVAQERRDQAILTAKARFFFALEHKVGVALSAMEKSAALPGSQQVLLTVLFMEIRLFVRSLKSALWLPRVIAWTTRQEVDDPTPQIDETATEIAKLSWFYTQAQTASCATFKRKNRPLLPHMQSKPDVSPSDSDDSANPFSSLSQRAQLLEVFHKGIVCNCLHLLVAVSGLLTGDDFNSLNLFLWRGCLDGPHSELHAPATFLTMQSMEKTSQMAKLIRNDLSSPQAFVRRQAAKRISLLAGWRFQLLSQNFITDKTHRRPFKLARAPNAFMATDIGSSTFVVEEKTDAVKGANGNIIPLELRKRLADIGWQLEDQVIDRKEELIRTPLSLLPSNQMDRQDGGISPTPSIPRSQSGESLDLALLPAVSSHNPVKRRPILVPPLASMLSDLARLAGDPDFTVAGAARSVILDLMKEDPSLITRPVLDAFSEGAENLQHAVSVLRSFLHLQQPLPPAMAHHLFNNITGFLKTSSRQENSPLSAFAHTIPLLSELSTQVSTMSIRDIRRAKVEFILVPSGSFWFTSSAPAGAMFPRSLYEAAGSSWANAREHLSNMTMVRAAQNMLFLNMLRRNPQDVQAIRKNMTRLVLPTYRDVGERPSIELHAFVARKRTSGSESLPDAELAGLSLMLSRSYVLLVAEVFRSLPRHMNDRNELAILMDGLNQVLLAHGDDIGVVAHVLIALMIASTRFRRIFTSSGGYTLFMPAVLKVYAENEANVGIRVAIQYAANRFYALHQEAFVFQSLDVLSHIMTFPDVDHEWMSEQIHSLFFSLKDDAPLTEHDHAGIHGANWAEERDAILINTAEERPQALFSLLRRGNGVNGPKVEIAVPEQREFHLPPHDMVRLFLTVIGHDPSIRRAEYFLRLFRYMAPHLYNASQSAQGTLSEGIEALGLIFISRSTGKNAKVPEAAQLQTGLNESNRAVFSQVDNFESDFVRISRAPSDLAEMRLEYLSLVAAFVRAGGSYSSSATHRIMDVVKIIMNNNDDTINQRVAAFLSAYSRSFLIRQPPVRPKIVVGFLGEIIPVYKAYASILDFSGVLSVLAELAEMPTYADDPIFSRQIVHDFCVRGLEACDFVASEGMVSTLAFRPALVKLLRRAILLKGVDIMVVLERQTITFDFLADVLFPFALAMPSTQDISRDTRWTERWRRQAPALAWTRLLLMVMTNCGKTSKTSASGSGPLERSNSKDKHDSTPKYAVATLLPIYMQIVKVIVLRAENDISLRLPGIWAELGLFIKSILTEGNATFALQAPDASAPPSPTLSPLNSKSQSMDDFNPFLGGSRPSSPVKSKFSQPRIVDYLLWSMLEFACLHRSPLLIQLRLLMQVNAATLDRDLRRQQAPSPRSRLSVFSKPRRHSGYYSGGPTPEGSPLLRPSLSVEFPHTPQKEERLPGYARFTSPLTSGDNEPVGAGARIVHLGPVLSPNAFFRAPTSPGGSRTEMHPHARMSQAARSATIQSAVLVRETYRRIRVVQQAMGYANPLPLLPGEREEDAGEAKAWTRVEALRAVIAEMGELMEEFGQKYGLVGEETVVIDPDESFG